MDYLPPTGACGHVRYTEMTWSSTKPTADLLLRLIQNSGHYRRVNRCCLFNTKEQSSDNLPCGSSCKRRTERFGSCRLALNGWKQVRMRILLESINYETAFFPIFFKRWTRTEPSRDGHGPSPLGSFFRQRRATSLINDLPPARGVIVANPFAMWTRLSFKPTGSNRLADYNRFGCTVAARADHLDRVAAERSDFVVETGNSPGALRHGLHLWACHILICFGCRRRRFYSGRRNRQCRARRHHGRRIFCRFDGSRVGLSCRH